jgi:NADPH:quinone reductase-like Zn-dependent oxidoreductase
MAVQIARILGAEAIGTASPANHDYVRSLGAEPVAYGDGLVERIRTLHPDGVDAVLDLVGGATLADSLELLRLPHRIASIVDAAGVAELGGRYIFVAADTAQLTQLGEWVDDGRLRIEVAAAFPLARAADAHRLLEQGHVRGKVVLTIGDDA